MQTVLNSNITIHPLCPSYSDLSFVVKHFSTVMFCQGHFKMHCQGLENPFKLCLRDKSQEENKTYADKCRCYLEQSRRDKRALCCATQENRRLWEMAGWLLLSMGTEAVISATRPDSISDVNVSPLIFALMFSSPFLSSLFLSFPLLSPTLTRLKLSVCLSLLYPFHSMYPVLKVRTLQGSQINVKHNPYMDDIK